VRSTTTPTVTSKVELKLTLHVDAPQPFYPGQRGWITYRYFYRGDIALTKEELPLLEPESFLKIGDKRIQESTKGSMSIREISQQIQAEKPGEFSFPPSIVEGYAYEEDPILKRRTYLQPKLHAETEAVSLEVTPFPSEDRPRDFQGALGQFNFSAKLLTPSQALIDDKMQLLLEISGKDGLWTVQLPSLEILKGLFRQGDLPPIGKVEGDTKQFVIEIYPLSTAITEIPSLTFSFFDPNKKQYVEQQSKPIPIRVMERVSEKSLQQKPSIQNSPLEEISPMPETMPSEVALPEIAPLKLFSFVELHGVSALEEAQRQYEAGKQSKTLIEKRNAFNAALTIYLHLQEQQNIRGIEGKFYYNLGNILFQLQQYPLATYYYYQANHFIPRDQQVRENLNKTLYQLGVPMRDDKKYFLFPSLSLAELSYMTVGMILILFICIFCYLFRRVRWLRNSIIFFAIVSLALGVALAYMRYFAPIEAVFIRSTILHRTPQEDAKKVGTVPILAGSKAKVLEQDQEGKWLKLVTPDKQLGYAPYTAIRIIS
jgi:hypothetical protein